MCWNLSFSVSYFFALNVSCAVVQVKVLAVPLLLEMSHSSTQGNRRVPPVRPKLRKTTVILRFLILILCITCVIGLWGVAPHVSYMNEPPHKLLHDCWMRDTHVLPTTYNASSLFPPNFVAMCLSCVEEMTEMATQESSVTTFTARRRAVQRAYARYDHVLPNAELMRRIAKGAPRGPMKAHHPAKVRFVCVSNTFDTKLFGSFMTATIAGVPLEVLGSNWEAYSHLDRYDVYLSYIERTGMQGNDVLVAMDADVLFSGEDLYPAVQAFVTLSPASAEELRDVLAIRQRLLMAPVRFAAEGNCMRYNVVSKKRCKEDDDTVERAMGMWASNHSIPYLSNEKGRSNNIRNLNGGFIIARVWAFKQFVAALKHFVSHNAPRISKKWACDQSAISTLLLQLRWWEMASGVLEGLPPRDMSPSELRAANVSRPIRLPSTGRGPSGLSAGLIDLDSESRWTLIVPYIYTYGERSSVFGVPIEHSTVLDEPFVQAHLAQHPLPLRTSATGVMLSPHFLQNPVRPAVDCTNKSEAHLLPYCQDPVRRSLALGLTPGTPITPLLWHISGRRKAEFLQRYYRLLPWKMALDVDPSQKDVVQETLWAAPPSRFWPVLENNSSHPHLVPYSQTITHDFPSACREIGLVRQGPRAAEEV